MKPPKTTDKSRLEYLTELNSQPQDKSTKYALEFVRYIGILSNSNGNEDNIISRAETLLQIWNLLIDINEDTTIRNKTVGHLNKVLNLKDISNALKALETCKKSESITAFFKDDEIESLKKVFNGFLSDRKKYILNNIHDNLIDANIQKIRSKPETEVVLESQSESEKEIHYKDFQISIDYLLELKENRNDDFPKYIKGLERKEERTALTGSIEKAIEFYSGALGIAVSSSKIPLDDIDPSLKDLAIKLNGLIAAKNELNSVLNETDKQEMDGSIDSKEQKKEEFIDWERIPPKPKKSTSTKEQKNTEKELFLGGVSWERIPSKKGGEVREKAHKSKKVVPAPDKPLEIEFEGKKIDPVDPVMPDIDDEDLDNQLLTNPEYSKLDDIIISLADKKINTGSKFSFKDILDLNDKLSKIEEIGDYTSNSICSIDNIIKIIPGVVALKNSLNEEIQKEFEEKRILSKEKSNDWRISLSVQKKLTEILELRTKELNPDNTPTPESKEAKAKKDPWRRLKAVFGFLLARVKGKNSKQPTDVNSMPPSLENSSTVSSSSFITMFEIPKNDTTQRHNNTIKKQSNHKKKSLKR